MGTQEPKMIKTRFTIAEAADLLKISEQDVIDLAAHNLPVCFHWRGTLAMHKRGQSLPVARYWFDGYLRSRTPVKKNVATHHMKPHLINGRGVIDEFTTYENILIPSTVEIVQSLSRAPMPTQLSDDCFLTLLDENGNQTTGTSAMIPPDQWHFEIDDLGSLSTGHERLGISSEPENLKSAVTTHPLEKWEIPGRLEYEARQIGLEWMRKKKPKPGQIDIAKYVENELKSRNMTGPRGDYWGWETIKKQALPHITGRKPNGKK